MFKTVTIAVFSLMAAVQAEWAYVKSPKNTIKAVGEKGQVDMTYWTFNDGTDPRIYVEMKLTTKTTKKDKKQLNMYLEWTDAKNWG